MYLEAKISLVNAFSESRILSTIATWKIAQICGRMKLSKVIALRSRSHANLLNKSSVLRLCVYMYGSRVNEPVKSFDKSSPGENSMYTVCILEFDVFCPTPTPTRRPSLVGTAIPPTVPPLHAWSNFNLHQLVEGPIEFVEESKRKYALINSLSS